MKVIIAAGWGYPSKIHATNIKSEFIARGLIKQGVDVLFLDALWGTFGVRETQYGISEKGVRYVSLPRKYGTFSVFANIFRVVSIFRKEKQYSDKNICISMFGFPMFPIEWFICKLTGYKKCMLYHEWYQCLGHNDLISKIYGWLGDNFVPRYMDAIHPISHYIEDHCRQFNKPIFNIPILSDFSDISIVPTDNKFTYCASAGYLLRNPIVFDAFILVKRQIKDVKLTLVLNQIGNMMDEVKKRIEYCGLNDSVEILHSLTQANLFHTFKTSIGLLIPLDPNNLQDKARFSQKIAEYISMQRPIITSSSGEIPYFFTNKKNAMVVDYSANSYADAMIYLLTNKKEASDIGKAGFITGQKNFDFQTCGKHLVDFYNQFL